MLWLLRRKKTQQARLDYLSSKLGVSKAELMCAAVEILFSLEEEGLLEWDGELIKTDPRLTHKELLRSIKNGIETKIRQDRR